MNEKIFAEPIKIRGHHISFFLEYLLWKYAPPAWDLFSRLVPKYGKLYVENIKTLFESLYAHPKQTILIVENIPDNLCDSGCLQRSEVCFAQTNHDQLAVECYGLKLWHSYPAGRFLKEIQNNQQIGKPPS